MGIGNSDSSGDTRVVLTQLHIRNFAIVPMLELEFQAGFTAITGETGAGKSILVDALGLLLGARSDAAWVPPGEERAELSAEFSVLHNTEALAWLHNSELSNGDLCLLRRTISSNGRSRAFINGSPVTRVQIQTLGQLLVEIHGQNEHLRLTKSAEQFRLLDGFGDYEKDLLAVKSAYLGWRKTEEKIKTLEQGVAVAPTELEFLNFQLSELRQCELSAEAINALHNMHDRLAAGGALQESLTTGIELLEPETTSANAGINADINSALGQLQQFIPLDSDIGAACQMLQEAAVNCAEAGESLRLARDRVDLNPARFESTANELSWLNDLARKHRVPMGELESVRDALSKRIERAMDSGQSLKELAIELAKRLNGYRKAAQKLHQKRRVKALELSGEVTVLMAELGMTSGTFELAVDFNPQATPSQRGDNEVQINISTNKGSPPGPLQKIASGGELSRISLAIKVAAAKTSEAITQIFDEVDAGIGGDTAIAVGQLLQSLADKGQALCVTHLAQVAVCATHQFQVSKASALNSTRVATSVLDKAGRVDEIARMLSGRISAQSRAHAVELLTEANPER